YFVAVFVLVLAALGIATVQMLTDAFLAGDAEGRRLYDPADLTIVVLPFAQLTIAVLGTLAVTSEFHTGTIRPTLQATPQRGRLFAGKALAIATVATMVGAVAFTGMVLASWFIAGDKPEPIKPWPSLGDGLLVAGACTLGVTVAALVAYGLGTALRSTAATLVTVTGLLYVVPMISEFLPSHVQEWVISLVLPTLPRLLVGAPENVETPLSQSGAAAALVASLVVALGFGWFALRTRAACRCTVSHGRSDMDGSGTAGGQTLMAMYLVSCSSSIRTVPPSRLRSDCFTPPNGVSGLDTMPWFR